MKKSLLLISSLLIFSSCGSNQDNPVNIVHVNYKPIAVNYTSSSVKAAAEAGLSSFVGDNWANYGFLSVNEFASAQLGTPYPSLALSNPGRSNQVVVAGDEWIVPVMVDNDYRCMLTVAKINNQWQTVTLAGATFAKLVQTAEKNHPLLDIKTKGIIKYAGVPTNILVINPTENQPSFLFLPPASELVRKIPQYIGWVNSEPVPALSFEDIFFLYSPR